MLIDFHTHTFPEAIAKKTLDMLLFNMQHTYNIDQKLCYGGTPNLLLQSMDKTGVDISVTMPIATNPKQFDSINKFSISYRTDRLIPFGAIHPYNEDIPQKLDCLKDNGFLGIKLHPDYQGVLADDAKFIDLVKAAVERGLYVTIHSGQDTGIKPPFCGDADRIERLLQKVDSEFIILAHMGAFNEWEDVLSLLAGKYKAYFDISVVSRFIDIELYRKIIDVHGADKILFGSDMPWELPSDTLAFLKKSGICGEELEFITHKNAEKILNLG